MTIQYKTLSAFATLAIVLACGRDNEKADGYGNFEATEITVSSQANGEIMTLVAEEGTQLAKDQSAGYIDTIQLSLKKLQLLASRKTIVSKSASVLSQIKVYEEQANTLEKEKQRVTNLLKDSAATSKQLDDINGQLNVLQKQVNNVRTQNASVLAELDGIDAQIAQLNDQIEKCIIRNPLTGTVLVKYAEAGEVASFGKPLYKLANLEAMMLRVYISETQLSQLKIGQKVKVKIDTANGMREMDGILTWISASAEFTPKIIQTKEERVNLVYAAKVSVKNDGSLKIGMPGEMWRASN